MFAVTCPSLGRDVMIHDRLIGARTLTAHGMVIEFACTCGAAGVRLNDPGAVSGRMVLHRPRQEAA